MNLRKKIAVIGLKGLPATGGAATVGEHIITVLKDQYDFTVYSISSHTSESSGHMDGYEQVVFDKFGNGGLNTLSYYVKSLLHVLFKGKYDAIHLHHCSSGFVTPFLRIRYKVLTTFHGIFRKDQPQFHNFKGFTLVLLKFAQWLNLVWSNVVISVSKSDALYIKEQHNMVVKDIPNGVFISGLHLDEQREEEDYWVFAANRIYEIKGLHVLLKAMKLNQDNRKLKIIGNLSIIPEYANAVKTLAKDLNVEFIDVISDKKELFRIIRGASLFIFPSLSEAMSMMLLEVASLKVPIIASDIPANKTVFGEDEVLFFKSGDIESLSQVLKSTEDADQLDVQCEKAFSRVKDEHDWNVIGKVYQEQFNTLL